MQVPHGEAAAAVPARTRHLGETGQVRCVWVTRARAQEAAPLGSPAAAQPPRWSSAEPWPSPSAFGTPRGASSPAASGAYSPVASEVPSPATIGTMRVLPRLKQKVEKMRSELASHKADADRLRRELQAEKERSALQQG